MNEHPPGDTADFPASSQPPQTETIGVLLLHGFTSSTATVSGLVPFLDDAGIPYEMPVLRGHGTRYEDLRGVTSKDWYADAEVALNTLSGRVDRVVVVGLSMGGLVSLELALSHPQKIAAVVTVGACLKFADPLAFLTGWISAVITYWPSPNAFNDPSLKGTSQNYTKFPTKTFGSLYRYAKEITSRLGEVKVPLRILQSRKDQVVAPKSAEILHRGVSSEMKEIVWFAKSGHEMMQDLEAERVFEEIMSFIHRFTDKESIAL